MKRNKKQMNKEKAILAIRRSNLDTPEMRYVVDQTKCFTCLDTKQLWREREGLPFSSWDGRGSYDVIKCNVCSSGHWDRCSATPDIRVNNYRIFKKGNNDMTVRVLEMEKEAKENYVKEEVKKRLTTESENEKPRRSMMESVVKSLGFEKEEIKPDVDIKVEIKEAQKEEEVVVPELPEWWLSKSRTIQRDATKIGVEVAVKEIANDVFSLIKGYSGDLLHIANWAKDFTINLSGTLEHCTSTNAHVEQFNDDKDGSTTFLILKFEKTDSVKTYKGYFYTYSKEKTSILSKVYLFKPKNNSAERICEKKVHSIIMRNMEGLDDI